MTVNQLMIIYVILCSYYDWVVINLWFNIIDEYLGYLNQQTSQEVQGASQPWFCQECKALSKEIESREVRPRMESAVISIDRDGRIMLTQGQGFAVEMEFSCLNLSILVSLDGQEDQASLDSFTFWHSSRNQLDFLSIVLSMMVTARRNWTPIARACKSSWKA